VLLSFFENLLRIALMVMFNYVSESMERTQKF